MKELKIETNIPIPTTRKHKYPYREMNVGDSVLLPTRKEAKSMCDSAKIWAENTKTIAYFTFAKDKKGYRVWRISDDTEKYKITRAKK